MDLGIGFLIWIAALTLLVIVGIVWILDLQSRLTKLRERRQKLLSGEEDADLAALVENLATRLTRTNARTERLVAQTEQLDQALLHTIQGVGLVRYRAFQDTGDQSFSLTLADGEGNGVIITALYGRNATRIYAKSMQGWLPSKALSEEEEESVNRARKEVLKDD